jgi:aprataxin
MLGAKANAPPSKKEGFARVTRCVNDWDVEQARSYYCRPRGRVVVGENRKSKIDAAPRTADRDANPNASANPPNPPNAPNAPNAFAQMMGAARASAGSSAKKTSGGASPPPSVSKTAAVNRGGWRDALSAMAADPAAFQKRGAVLFFDDELVVARDAYPKSRTHLLVLARDTRLTEGPKAMRSTDAALVRRMARVGEAHARTLAASSPPRESAAAAADADDDDAERFRFRCGFHASPSMRTAHMHVVSGDLRGVGMKTRRHWNSFATSFFKEAEETARDLERAEAESISGDASSGTRWDVAELERVVAMTPLRCHKCGDGPFPTMPKLFAHTDACVRVGFSTRTDAL